MKQYKDFMNLVMEKGTDKGDRTGTGTRSIFGHQIRYDLRDGFPLSTLKKVHLKSIIHELLWFLKGDTNTKYLEDNGVKIWREWQREDGELGAIYSKQWREWESPNGETIDQITNVIERIKVKPDCRRLIVNAWNPSDIPDDNLSFTENVNNGKGALPPCHSFFQLYSREMHPNDRLHEFEKHYIDMIPVWDLRQSEYEAKMDELNFPTRYIDMQMYQRSCDVFLGNFFNTPSYALLLMMIGREVNMIPCDFVHTYGDAHIYNNHMEQVKILLNREPRELPTIVLNPNVNKVLDFKYEDFTLLNYNPHSKVKGVVAK